MKALGPNCIVARRSALPLAVLCVALCARSAAATAEPLEGLRACRAIADPTMRLACFDRESASLMPPDKGAALAPEQKFGLSATLIAAKESAAGARPADLPKLDAQLIGLRQNGDGRGVFTDFDLVIQPGQRVGCQLDVSPSQFVVTERHWQR